MRKKLVAVGTAIGVAALPLVAATPAAAAPISVRVDCLSNVLTLTPSNVTAGVGDQIQLVLGYPGTFQVTATGASGTTPITSSSSYTVSSASGGSIDVKETSASNCENDIATLTFGPGGGGSSTGDSEQPPVFALTFNSEDGTTCTPPSIEGAVGSWVALPSASECTRLASRSGATLLGWATTSAFPVEIAQRQVENGWGAYEIFNSDGSIAEVFIPAGGSARIAAPDQLNPIWSQ